MSQERPSRLIGDVLKTFGAHGEVIVKIREHIPRSILQNKEPIFIFIDGLSVPFYMKFAEPKGTNKLVVVFEDMETEPLAAELIGKSIYLFCDKDQPKEESDVDMLVGYAVLDKSGASIGIINEVMRIPGNPCLVVARESREIIIPLNEELIVKVDAAKKQICLDVPDGLLELYSQ